MKWKSLATVAVVTLAFAASGLAQQPVLTSMPTPAPVKQARRPIFSQISWWAKYGEPVSYTAQEGVPPATLDAGAAGEAPVMHDHGYGFGYVYGPGSCDYSAPCIDQLWSGYAQMPWRCGHPHYHHRYRGFGGQCGSCGTVSDCGRTAPACAAPACDSPIGCAQPADCACDMAHACSKCKPRKQWFAHWNWGKKCCNTCDSCSTGIGCGCAAPIGNGLLPTDDPDVAPPAPVPAGDEASILKTPQFRKVSTSASRTR